MTSQAPPLGRCKGLLSAGLLLAGCTGPHGIVAPPALDSADSGTARDTGDSAAPPPPASVGDLTPTLSFDTLHDGATPTAVEDLDGDGSDELILTWGGGAAAILRPDLATASVEMTWLPGEYRGVWAAGNGQLLVEDEAGHAALRLAASADGWGVSERVNVGTTWCASPTGDLDGDGTDDVLVKGGDDVLQVVRGPVRAGYEVIAEVQGWSTLRCDAASGDVDGDGHDDLAWVESADDSLRVAFGPVRGGEQTVDTLPDLQLDVGQTVGDARALVTPDLDGDGAAEVVVLSPAEVLGFDAVDRTTATLVPEWTLEQAGMWGAATTGEGMLVFSHEAAGWWREAPSAAAARPPAAAAIPSYGAVVAGRFGSGSALDLAWVRSGTVYVMPGARGRGTDLDRDGSAAPDDCDDVDPAVRADAPELADGRDNDCDGAIDESTAVEPPVVAERPGDRNAFLGAAGLVAWPSGGTTPAVFSTELGQRAWVATLLVDDAVPLPPLPTADRIAVLASAGDIDADGLADLAVLQGGDGHAVVIHGPAPGGAVAAIDLPLDGVWSLAPVGDLDADGHADLLAGGGHYRLDSDSEWVFDQRLVWVSGNGLAGQAIDGMGAPEAVGPVDLNDDGYSDLLLVEAEASFWFGPIVSAGDLAADSASGTFTAAPRRLYTGDLDRDGVGDLLGAGDDGVGVAYGPWTAASWEFTAEVDARVTSAPVSAVAWGSDWLFATTTSGDWQAQVLGHGLPLAGDRTADDAELRVLAPQPRSRTGSGLLVADLDGDGREELVVASPREAAPADDEGVLRVYALPPPGAPP